MSLGRMRMGKKEEDEEEEEEKMENGRGELAKGWRVENTEFGWPGFNRSRRMEGMNGIYGISPPSALPQ
jgi:hypothetical protein